MIMDHVVLLLCLIFGIFLVFVDDYSIMSWVYLWITQVSNVIKKFINEIKTQFPTTIRVLRTIMLLSILKEVSRFCESHGILYQTTRSHTSKENETAKRKLKYFLDVARTLLINMHVPKFFLTEAILCACHLINKMPS